MSVAFRKRLTYMHCVRIYFANYNWLPLNPFQIRKISLFSPCNLIWKTTRINFVFNILKRFIKYIKNDFLFAKWDGESIVKWDKQNKIPVCCLPILRFLSRGDVTRVNCPQFTSNTLFYWSSMRKTQISFQHYLKSERKNLDLIPYDILSNAQMSLCSPKKEIVVLL